MKRSRSGSNFGLGESPITKKPKHRATEQEESSSEDEMETSQSPVLSQLLTQDMLESKVENLVSLYMCGNDRKY